MYGRTFLTAAVSNISFSMFSINNSNFVSLALYQVVYLACRTDGDENELVIFSLLHSLGSIEVD